MDNLMGVILCGGNSSRMGRDKGLILKEGLPWARHMADKLAPFDIPVVFSINPTQVDDYAAFVPPAELVVDATPVAGPLKGLLSVHAKFPDKDLLLLACDLPDMDHATISQIIDAYLSGGPYEFYAYQEGAFFQPFCGIYTSIGLDSRHGSSLQELLKSANTKALAVFRPDVFKNYNTM